MGPVRYEIKVTPLAGVVRVEAVLFAEARPGLPPLGTQFITKGFGGSEPCVSYVWPPNWWERWRGVTWDLKVEQAKVKVERWARQRVSATAEAKAAAATATERGAGRLG